MCGKCKIWDYIVLESVGQKIRLGFDLDLPDLEICSKFIQTVRRWCQIRQCAGDITRCVALHAD